MIGWSGSLTNMARGHPTLNIFISLCYCVCVFHCVTWLFNLSPWHMACHDGSCDRGAVATAIYDGLKRQPPVTVVTARCVRGFKQSNGKSATILYQHLSGQWHSSWPSMNCLNTPYRQSSKTHNLLITFNTRHKSYNAQQHNFMKTIEEMKFGALVPSFFRFTEH